MYVVSLFSKVCPASAPASPENVTIYATYSDESLHPCKTSLGLDKSVENVSYDYLSKHSFRGVLGSIPNDCQPFNFPLFSGFLDN